MSKQETIVKRLQLRLYSEGESVKDETALVETLVVRHLDRLESLSRDCMKSWVISALKNQYLLELGMNKVGATNGISVATGLTPETKESLADLEQGLNETLPVDDNWSQDPSAAESMSLM